MPQDKIMIVDNEEEIIQLIRTHLIRQGYDVVWTTQSSDALLLLQKEQPSLVLLDIMMPGPDGYELCSQIRRISSVPVLFMSCKGKDIDKVMGFSIGGDDYITKPFSLTELTARIQAHIRRYRLTLQGGAVSPDTLSASAIACGSLKIDPTAHTVYLGENELSLTAKEYDLLCLFARYPNRVFTSRQIFDTLWNPYGLENDARTVAVHISNLRKKLEEADPFRQYIHTVRGIGYKLMIP